jgi:hypothetical protein
MTHLSNSRTRAVNCGNDVDDCAYSGRLLRNAVPVKGARRLPEPLRRALEIRVAALEEEQAAGIREFDQLYARSDELSLQIAERQRRLRSFREILLVTGAA